MKVNKYRNYCVVGEEEDRDIFYCQRCEYNGVKDCISKKLTDILNRNFEEKGETDMTAK